jgi:hypothetical protein
VATLAAAVLDRPWRGTRTRGPFAKERGALFESELSGKGTAMVAKDASITERDPRPHGGSFGGSSGGQAIGRIGRSLELGRRQATVSRSIVEGWVRNPKDGASRRNAGCQVTCGAKRPRRRNARGAIGRSWGPGAREERRNRFFTRTLHATGDVEGEQNPMRGGCTHWAGVRRKRARWMSAGRPRVKR